MGIELAFLKRFICVLSIVAVSATIGGCDLLRNQMQFDRAGNKELQDYRSALDPRPAPKASPDEIPGFHPVVSTPASLKLPSPLVTVSVNRTVSLRDIMFELTEQAGVDLEMDPQITGSLIFTAKDRPFDEVIDRICKMVGLRYKFSDNILRVEIDRPYLKHYKIDYMVMTRTSSSSITNSVSVTGNSGDNATTDSGSSSSIEGEYESTFWSDFEEGITQVLASSDQYISLATIGDPRSQVRAAPQPVPTEANPNPAPNLSPPTLSVSTTADPFVRNPPASFTISQETGIVSVYANERQHKLVKEYIDDMRKNSMAQIQIEAKILEVSLSDKHSTGIDWGNIEIFDNEADNPVSLNMSFPTPGTALAGTFTVNLGLAKFFQPVVNALSNYGTVRALSSPRVTVMNARPAVVNMTKNIIYFTIEEEQSTTSGDNPVTTTTRSSTPQTAAEGVLLNVLPTANVDTGEIILSIRPTVSNISQMVQDPINTSNSVPEMSIQEIDSVVRIQSGQTIVMGGIMRDNNTITKNGAPVLGDLPVLGKLFSGQSDVITKSELVILLQATLIPGANADDTDRDLYKSYALDRHPFRF